MTYIAASFLTKRLIFLYFVFLYFVFLYFCIWATHIDCCFVSSQEDDIFAFAIGASPNFAPLLTFALQQSKILIKIYTLLSERFHLSIVFRKCSPALIDWTDQGSVTHWPPCYLRKHRLFGLKTPPIPIWVNPGTAILFHPIQSHNTGWCYFSVFLSLVPLQSLTERVTMDDTPISQGQCIIWAFPTFLGNPIWY